MYGQGDPEVSSPPYEIIADHEHDVCADIGNESDADLIALAPRMAEAIRAWNVADERRRAGIPDWERSIRVARGLLRDCDMSLMEIIDFAAAGDPA